MRALVEIQYTFKPFKKYTSFVCNLNKLEKTTLAEYFVFIERLRQGN